jgi:long-chain acyl-CoA synthetase
LLSENYGSSETGIVTWMPPEMHHKKLGSSGAPLGHVDIQIRDESNRTLSAGSIGEIWVKSPATIDRYFQGPQFSAVIGIPDDNTGEAVHAFCELDKGLAADEPELLRHCLGQLTSYKCPKSVQIVANLPRNAMGKILKAELRAPFWRGHNRKI